MYKKILIAAFVLIGISSKSFAQSVNAQMDSVKTISVKVKGVTCNNDLKTLSSNVKELKGVAACKPGKAGPTSVFKITYNPALVSTTEIYKAIENTAGCGDPSDRPYKVKTN